jgi:polygalacturonase
MHRYISAVTSLLVVTSAHGDTPRYSRNPDAIAEIQSGRRTVADAAWWGFDEEDATDALQAAIHSGAKKVIVPNMTRDWFVRPIQLAGNQELVLEAGVVITAKRGAYRGRGDSVFTARNVSDLTIRGYGATVRMQKEDYIVGKVLLDLGWNRWYGQYEKAEWRMTLSLRGCTNVQVLGLTLTDSGGDGIYVAGTGQQGFSKDVHIRDVVCDNHYRQGISVISAVGLTVENSVFRNTWGTPPSAGVDLEPDKNINKLQNILFRNCRFEDNYGDGIKVHLARLTDASDDVSIRFDHCRVTSRRGTGICVTKIRARGAHGLIEFRDCVVENTVGYGIKVQDKSAERARVKFVDCMVRNAANDRDFNGAWSPVWLHMYRPQPTGDYGGIDFVNCDIEDDHDRPPIAVTKDDPAGVLHDITGTLAVRNPHGVRMNLGEPENGVTLRVTVTQP